MKTELLIELLNNMEMLLYLKKYSDDKQLKVICHAQYNTLSLSGNIV